MSLWVVLFAVLFILLGLILIIGAYNRWGWLVDPPTDMWPYYSQALLKKLFGSDFVVVETYFIGFLLILLASIFLVNALLSL